MGGQSLGFARGMGENSGVGDSYEESSTVAVFCTGLAESTKRGLQGNQTVAPSRCVNPEK